VRISWYQGSTLLGLGDSMTVCPTTTTSYRATASYTMCQGPPVVIADTITIHANYLAVQPSTQNVSCYGYNDGFASVNVNGGTPPYTYSWSPNSSSTNTASGLTAGSYTATVWDASYCFNTATVSITQPPLLTLSDSSVATTCSSCSDGIIILTASGGNPSYYYNISPPAGNQIGGFFYNLPAGDYFGCVTDVNGCMTCDSVTVDMFTNVASIGPLLSASFHPNPFSTVTVLELKSNLTEDIYINIFDAPGRLIFSEKISSTPFTLNREKLGHTGIYFFQIKNSLGKLLSGKLILTD
jgi:hypothetical protein